MWFFPGRKGNVPETLVGSRTCARNRFFTERTGSPINSRPFRPNSSLVRSDQRSGQTQGSRRPFVRRATAWGGSPHTPRSRCATWLESSLPPRPLALPAAAGMLAGPTREWDTRNRWPQMDYGFSRTRHHDSSSPRDLIRSDHCCAQGCRRNARNRLNLIVLRDGIVTLRYLGISTEPTVTILSLRPGQNSDSQIGRAHV